MASSNSTNQPTLLNFVATQDATSQFANKSNRTDFTFGEILQNTGAFANQAFNPFSPGFFQRGVPGLLSHLIQEAQRNPISFAPGPIGDVDALREANRLISAGHPIAGTGLTALAALGLGGETKALARIPFSTNVGKNIKGAEATIASRSARTSTRSADDLQAQIDTREIILEARGIDPVTTSLSDQFLADPGLEKLYDLRDIAIQAEDATTFGLVAKHLPKGPASKEVVENIAKEMFDADLSFVRISGRPPEQFTQEIVQSRIFSIYSDIQRQINPNRILQEDSFEALTRLAKNDSEVADILEQATGVFRAFFEAGPEASTGRFAVQSVIPKRLPL